MIVKSREPRVVGQRYDRLWVSDNAQRRHDVPFLVLRTATLDEWIADATSDQPPPTAHAIRQAAQPGMHFYDISVD